ncbi:MAG: hypothetical protein ACRYHQ_26235 [Janthinobacterium lividum]
MTLAELEPNDDVAAATGVAGELRLDGFAGSLDLLAVVEQLIQATRFGTAMPLSSKADWTVIASWLLRLRSHLMLPAADPRHPAAEDQAQRLQAQLLTVQEARFLARWLDEPPQLGREVFVRGAPEPDTEADPGAGQPDRVDLLWARIALFDGDWSEPALELRAV